MVLRLVICYTTAMQTLPRSSDHLRSHPAPVSHITLALTYGPSRTLTPSGCVMSRQSRCMQGSERANFRVPRVVPRSLLMTALLTAQMTVKDSAQPRQSLQ
jgi:hypothetical protein